MKLMDPLQYIPSRYGKTLLPTVEGDRVNADGFGEILSGEAESAAEIGDASRQSGRLRLGLVAEEGNYFGDMANGGACSAAFPVLDRFNMDAKSAGEVLLHEMKGQAFTFEMFAERL